MTDDTTPTPTADTVGERAQDARDTATEYRKEVVVPTRQKGHVDHEANEHLVRQEAIQRGLRVTGTIAHRSADAKPSKGSTTITYTAPAVLVEDATEDQVHQAVDGSVPMPAPVEEHEADESDEDLNPDESTDSTPAQ